MGIRLIHKYPFTTWALVALLAHACIIAFDVHYDEGGVGSILLLSSPAWGVMYWLPNELFLALNNGHSMEGQLIVSVLVGLALCLLADLVVGRIRRRSLRSASM